MSHFVPPFAIFLAPPLVALLLENTSAGEWFMERWGE